jgi:hypothetical protein
MSESRNNSSTAGVYSTAKEVIKYPKADLSVTDVSTVIEVSSFASIDPDFLARKSKYLITLLNWLIKRGAEAWDLPGPGAYARFYLNFFKVHLVVLARVLVSVKKIEPIANQVEELERNIASYVKETNDVARKTLKDFPASPWQDINSGIVIMLAPVLAQDRRFVEEWNRRLNAYETLFRAGVEVTEYLVEQGRDIERETPQKVAELHAEIEKLEASISMDILNKLAYKRKLDWLILSLTRDVQPARHAAEEANSFLQKGLLEAQRAQRL